jgi:hypothetical protein
MTQLIVNSPSASHIRPLIQAALDHEISMLQMGIEKTKCRLCHFEELFKMETLRFYQAFQAGDMGDEMEYIKWAGEYETLLQLEEDFFEQVKQQFSKRRNCLS